MSLNTTKIGDDFESRSLDIIKKIISEEQLGHIAKYLKITPQARYYSHQRKADIIFDLTIEVWPPGANRYTIIYIIECKNYQRRVSVDKIKSFLYDINDIGFANAKGIFITNSPLQKAAYNIANSTGVMVVEGESANDYKITLYKSNREKLSGKIPFIEESININLSDQGVELMEKLIDQKLLDALYENINTFGVSYGLDKLSKESIENIVNIELNRINPDILTQAYHISPKSFIEFLKKEYDIEVKQFISRSSILGSYDFDSNIIQINPNIIETPREFFVLAHEFGHFILHQKLKIGQMTYDNFNDSEYDFSIGKHHLNNPRHWIEWQANYFASALVLPRIPLYVRLALIMENIGRPKGKIYVDDKYQNQTDFNDIVSKLAYRFSVSKTSVIYKLNEMNLIDNRSNVKSIGTLIAEFREGLFT